MKKELIAGIALMASAACSPNVPTVAERYLTPSDEAMNIDSVATYPIGDRVWLFATAKEGHLIQVFDAESGEHLRDLGALGEDSGQFQRPNGILAADGMLIVVERDNRRVQVLSLPSLAPLALFGQAELIKPYGAYLEPTGTASYRLFVTDAYETADERVPPPDQLDRRVQVYVLTVTRAADGSVTQLEARHESSFGATAGPGVLHVVESIWGDPDNDRLMIAEEDPAGGRVLKVYSFDGGYTGPLVGEGIFATQPEGIALATCPDGSGYWITTDQSLGRNVFHLFDRQTLAHVGGFMGEVTRNTDGIWLTQKPMPAFPAGAFFAVHDDQAVAAFDWRDIAAALELPPGC